MQSMKSCRTIKSMNNASLFHSAAMVVFACLALSTSVQAEGMKELCANGGDRPFLIYQNANGFGIISGKTNFKVYVVAGETLSLGSSAQGKGNGTINVTAPDGVTTFTSGSAAAGLITNLAQENAGPLPNAGGFTPFIITAAQTTGRTGIWTVEFVSPDATKGTTPSPLAVTAAWTQSTTVQFIDSFDVTVRNSGGTTQLGRCFANYLFLFMGGNPNPFNAKLFVLTKDGYQYQVNANGLDPNEFAFWSNNRGYIANNADPVNHPQNSALYH